MNWARFNASSMGQQTPAVLPMLRVRLPIYVSMTEKHRKQRRFLAIVPDFFASSYGTRDCSPFHARSGCARVQYETLKQFG